MNPNLFYCLHCFSIGLWHPFELAPMSLWCTLVCVCVRVCAHACVCVWGFPTFRAHCFSFIFPAPALEPGMSLRSRFFLLQSGTRIQDVGVRCPLCDQCHHFWMVFLASEARTHMLKYWSLHEHVRIFVYFCMNPSLHYAKQELTLTSPAVTPGISLAFFSCFALHPNSE